MQFKNAASQIYRNFQQFQRQSDKVIIIANSFMDRFLILY
jgi:hypothetical protein